LMRAVLTIGVPVEFSFLENAESAVNQAHGGSIDRHADTRA